MEFKVVAKDEDSIMRALGITEEREAEMDEYFQYLSGVANLPTVAEDLAMFSSFCQTPAELASICYTYGRLIERRRR